MDWQLAGRSTRHRTPNALIINGDRAPLRRTDFEQFGYTDNCLGCANARAGRRQAVGHSEQCRSRMEAILATTTEGHMRLQRAWERFAQFAEEPGVMESSCKRHRPEGEGREASRAISIGCSKQLPERKQQQQRSWRCRLRHRQPPQHLLWKLFGFDSVSRVPFLISTADRESSPLLR